MNKTPARLLVVDDDPVTLNLLNEVLSKEGYEVETALGGEEAIAKGMDQLFDIVITDVKMGDKDGMEVLRSFKKNAPDTTVIMITAFGSIETAIEAIREGAFDYISKPFKLEEIKITIQRALEQRRLLQENKQYRQELLGKYQFENFIGRTPQILQVYKTIAKVANTKSTVLIYGESGTGKELVARSIHYNSQRNQRPFIPVDCASLVETLLETELFGHVRGAFTGALSTKKGLFEEADGGTLFIDELSNLNLSLQTKLLRFLQEHEIKRVGGTESIKVDVRVIAATNQPLEPLIKKGTFREDLFYRLNVVYDHPPPVEGKKRGYPLAGQSFSAEVLRRTSQGHLSHITGGHGNPDAVSLAGECSRVGEHDRTGHHPLSPPDHPSRRPSPKDPREPNRRSLRSFSEKPLSLKEVEKSYVLKVLQETKGNKKKAAEILGIDRTTLYRILEKE